MEKNTKAERFVNPSEEDLQKVTMQQLESLYITSMVHEDGTVVKAKMPYLVCLALNGNLAAILKLEKKYPLMKTDGWSYALETKLKTEGVYLLIGTKNPLDEVEHKRVSQRRISVIVALGISRKKQNQKLFSAYYEWNGITSDDIDVIDEFVTDEMRDFIKGAIEEAEYYLDLKTKLEEKTKGEA